MVAALTAGWLLWRGIYEVSPRFDFALIRVNNESQKVLSGETLRLHPKDSVKILKISTNMISDLGVRLVSSGFDVGALRHEEMILSALLPDQEIFDHYNFRVWIKYRNQELGYIDWQVQPGAKDWLDKASRTINSDHRLAILERAARLLPDNRKIKSKLLEEYRSLKRWGQLAAMLEGMAKKKPDQEILVDLLEVYTTMQSEDDIISVLKRLIELNPDDLGSRNQLAEIYEKSGKLKEAIIEYEGLIERLDKKDRLPFYDRLGYLYTKIDRFKKAVFFYLKAVELDKKDANLYYNLAYLYEKIDQKEKADFYLATAVSLRSKDIEGRLTLAESFIKKKDLKKAKEYLSEVLAEKPKSLEALLLMGQVLEKLGEKKELKKIYERILSIEPKNEAVIFNLGVLEYETGNLKVSLNYLETYLKLHPKDFATHEILFDIYKRQNNVEMALREAHVLVELRPKEIGPYYYIFDQLAAKGDYEAIIRVMEKGLEVNPKQADLRGYLVLAYLETGNEELAIEQIEKILKVRPEDMKLLLHMARLREKREEYSKALVAYEKILELSPDHEEAQEAYLRLKVKGLRGDGQE